MNIGIEVNVYYLKDEGDIAQQEAGIPVDLSNCVLKSYTLYSIDYVTDYDKERCIVSSGGMDFIIKESRENFKARLNAIRNSKWN